MAQSQNYTIRQWHKVNTLTETTDQRVPDLSSAEDCVMRPLGGVSRAPTFYRLWALTTMSDYKATLSLTGASNVALIEIKKHGLVWLLFYDCSTDKTMGFFFAGSDGSYAGYPDLAASGGVTMTVLGTGYTVNKRWNCYRMYDELYLGNGYDDNMIYQLDRTPKLRTQGSNAVPRAAVIAAITPNQYSTAAYATLVISGAGRAGGQDLTFQSASQSADGNFIDVIITASGLSQALSSTMTGSGTTSDHYIYTITTGTTAEQSSNNALVSFVNSDLNATGILTLATEAADATADPTFALVQTSLSGGVTDGISTGFTDTEKSVYVAYWDPGTNEFGYESSKSLKSNVVAIAFNTLKDIQVRVFGDTSGALARFTKLRIYLQFGSPSAPTWLLIKEVDNEDGVHYLGTDLIPGKPIETNNQEKPPKSRIMIYSKGRVWYSGNPTNPSRIWISKYAQSDEIVPEGCYSGFYIEVGGPTSEPGVPEITALIDDQSKVHIHTHKAVTTADPISLTRLPTQSAAGALNQRCVVRWPNGRYYYLGQDLQIYEVSGQAPVVPQMASRESRVVSRVIDPSTANDLDTPALAYADARNMLVWMWVPGDTGQQGFLFDPSLRGMVGPLAKPSFVDIAEWSVTDPRLVGADMNGNLFAMDPYTQYEPSNVLSNSSAYTIRSSGYTVPADNNGWSTVNVTSGLAGTAGKVLKATTMRLATSWLNLGQPNVKKNILSVQFTTVRYSRGLVTVTINSDTGNTIVREFGEVYGQENHKVFFLMSGFAFQVIFEVINAEDAPFQMRDMSIQYKLAGQK